MITTLFKFETTADLEAWEIVDDNIVGGQSGGSLSINDQGTGVFEGKVRRVPSREFCFLGAKYHANKIAIASYAYFILRIKGDHTLYQFRVRADEDDNYSCKTVIKTDGNWQTHVIPFSEMTPPFKNEKLQAFTFLVSNDQDESFRLFIDYIAISDTPNI